MLYGECVLRLERLMIPMAILHSRLGPWLAGLFLVAQIVGVVSLMSSHAAHVAEAGLALTDTVGSAGDIPRGHHYRGDADGFVQHHELQDLSGAFLGLIIWRDIAFAPAAIIFETQHALAGADPVLIERPPKSSLSI